MEKIKKELYGLMKVETGGCKGFMAEWLKTCRNGAEGRRRRAERMEEEEKDRNNENNKKNQACRGCVLISERF